MIKKLLIKIILINLILATNVSAKKENAGFLSDLITTNNISPKTKKIKEVDSALNRIKKGDKLLSKGKSEKAEEFYKEALKYLMNLNSVDPINPETIYLIGYCHERMGDIDNAEIYYELGLTIKPDHPGLNFLLAKLFFETDRKEESIKIIKKLKNCNCEEFNILQKLIEG